MARRKSKRQREQERKRSAAYWKRRRQEDASLSQQEREDEESENDNPNAAIAFAAGDVAVAAPSQISPCLSPTNVPMERETMVPAADSNYATSDPSRSLGEENTNRSATTTARSPFGLLETDDNGNRVDNPRQQIQIDNLVPTFTARSFANASQQVSPEVGVERPSLNPTPPTITGPTPATAPTTTPPRTTTRTLLQAHMLARSTHHWYFPTASRPADFDPSWHPPLPPTRVNESELEE